MKLCILEGFERRMHKTPEKDPNIRCWESDSGHDEMIQTNDSEWFLYQQEVDRASQLPLSSLERGIQTFPAVHSNAWQRDPLTQMELALHLAD